MVLLTLFAEMHVFLESTNIFSFCQIDTLAGGNVHASASTDSLASSASAFLCNGIQTQHAQ